MMMMTPGQQCTDLERVVEVDKEVEVNALQNLLLKQRVLDLLRLDHLHTPVITLETSFFSSSVCATCFDSITPIHLHSHHVTPRPRWCNRLLRARGQKQ